MSYQVNISAIPPESANGLIGWFLKLTTPTPFRVMRNRDLDVHDYIKTMLSAVASELRRDACIGKSGPPIPFVLSTANWQSYSWVKGP